MNMTLGVKDMNFYRSSKLWGTGDFSTEISYYPHLTLNATVLNLKI